MSEEFKIPPDLSVFESQLGSFAVPESRLDRDEVLYQAGWAAALAASNSTMPSKGFSNGKNWAWPTATGVFATLATLLAIMLFQQSTVSNGNTVSSSVASSQTNDKSGSAVVNNDGALEQVENRNGGLLDGGLLQSHVVIGSARGRRFAIDLDSDPTRLRRAIGGRFLDEEIGSGFLPTIETNRGGFTNVKATSELLRELSPNQIMRQRESKQKSWFTKSWEAVL